MKQLAENMNKTLANIGQMIAEREAEDPVFYTYLCPSCSDTGFNVVGNVLHRKMRQRYTVGAPCGNCMTGQRIAMRIAAARAELEADRKMSQEARRARRVRQDIEAAEEPPF